MNVVLICFCERSRIIHHAGSSLLALNIDHPGLSGKSVMFLEKRHMHSFCSLRKQIAKSKSHSQNVFIKGKKRKLSVVEVQF